MAFVRSIGRWTMTALVINCIVGGGIFGFPGELNRLLGRASPLAVIIAGLGVAVLMACFAEVASQFSEPGGAYLYVRTAFGRFCGMQIGWIEMLSVVAGLAALTDLFVDYLAALLSWKLGMGERALLIVAVIALPAAANYLGVRAAGRLSNLTTVAKLAPIVLLLVVGVARFATHPQSLPAAEITSHPAANWARAFAFLLVTFGGWEDSVLPAGEIAQPRRTIPFGLGAALLVCVVVYTVLQFVVVATAGPQASDMPLQEAAGVLLGSGAATFVSLAALISVYGWISAAMLYSPRLFYSLGAQRDVPAIFATLHPRFRTPTFGILIYALVGGGLAVTGAFVWLMAVGAGTMMIIYAAVCAALLRLRRRQPEAAAFRVPFGRAVALAGIAISLALLLGLERREIALIAVTLALASANWLWARWRAQPHRSRHTAA